MIIYKVENLLNNKCYIGKTTRQTLENRKKEHISNLKTNRDLSLLCKAIKKYGQNNFEWSSVWNGNCSEKWLNELEKYYIYFYDSFKNGYNLTKGGDGGERCSQNTKIKISTSLKGKYLSEDTKKKLSESHKEQIPWIKGKHHSEKTKRNLSFLMKGKNTWTTGRIPWNKGKQNIYSDETKQRMSNSQKGKIPSQETKKKLSESMKGKQGYWKGKKLSEEHKRKMSESHQNLIYNKRTY